ncbi:hypothetical protein HanPI659440_Chr02g0079251 [Helianthus annuus]|nr:hypothetical protein HanPI659440_Chr02g0079251 [Helianthus annuus]
MVSHELGEDYKWLINCGIPLLADSLMASEELAKYMLELGGAAYDSGRKTVMVRGKCLPLKENRIIILNCSSLIMPLIIATNARSLVFWNLES